MKCSGIPGTSMPTSPRPLVGLDAVREGTRQQLGNGDRHRLGCVDHESTVAERGAADDDRLATFSSDQFIGDGLLGARPGRTLAHGRRIADGLPRSGPIGALPAAVASLESAGRQQLEKRMSGIDERSYRKMVAAQTDEQIDHWA